MAINLTTDATLLAKFVSPKRIDSVGEHSFRAFTVDVLWMECLTLTLKKKIKFKKKKRSFWTGRKRRQMKIGTRLIVENQTSEELVAYRWTRWTNPLLIGIEELSWWSQLRVNCQNSTILEKGQRRKQRLQALGDVATANRTMHRTQPFLFFFCIFFNLAIRKFLPNTLPLRNVPSFHSRFNDRYVKLYDALRVFLWVQDRRLRERRMRTTTTGFWGLVLI